MRETDFEEDPHRRYNPLKGEWVLVSPHRNKRPWMGKQEKAPVNEKPRFDEKCYLCPGNARTSGAVNPDYHGPYVFDNDFPALLTDTPLGEAGDGALFRAETVCGTARVICFSERHDITLPEMSAADIRKVVDLWAEQLTELGATYEWVAMFENKGEMMGCSQPHPHGQIWACNFLPNEIACEDEKQKAYFEEKNSVLLVDYAAQESRLGLRTVVENEHFIAVVPYWATWPFETLVMPKRHVLRLTDLDDAERDACADIFRRLTCRYDNLFETEFPYSMGWHGAPTMEGNFDHWQLHAHFYPPLLRSATVRKFMVGFELLSEAQRDMTAESAADRLRSLSDVHYKEQ
ncbi:UDPglucose--hexose-1-phosphate uridylyltransferase [Cohaesibacter sp. ES.047]|uniref:UDP-glucose--hexose-1-phosphate uridylyltransferase n=1 Tax=Cohaesibacter sp. ES.047 TaxID=1798205 RepID=UPI000BB71354|nr:UDP-glucose--hexose-1-phosphate uridylyltransferase [Cohaesibacter sp. ES.047]SNY90043.1 UDPglucose--hexose-1-phosphate uridylyltransferase [Cohaesibacter sp. ES.047]